MWIFRTAGPVLGQACNSTVLCKEGTECATDSKCRCPSDSYDDNKDTVGGTCRNSKYCYLELLVVRK